MEGLVIAMGNEFWKNKNVFITGCTGFLGGYLSEALIKSGANVVGLVRDYLPNANLFREKSFSKMSIVNGSLENLETIERVLGEYEIDTVFHLAAQAIVGVANRNPLSTFQANILGTWNILEACRRSPLIKRIIVASSDKAYGD